MKIFTNDAVIITLAAIDTWYSGNLPFPSANEGSIVSNGNIGFLLEAESGTTISGLQMDMTPYFDIDGSTVVPDEPGREMVFTGLSLGPGETAYVKPPESAEFWPARGIQVRLLTETDADGGTINVYLVSE